MSQLAEDDLLFKSEDMKYILEHVESQEICNIQLSDDDVVPEAYDTVPSNEAYSGDFDFSVLIPPSKNAVYSAQLRKLYIKMRSDVTVQYKWNFFVGKPLFVRAKPRFSKPEDSNKPVKRCLQHAHKKEISNAGFEHIRHHILRSKNTQAIYEGGALEHHSVLVPLELPDIGADVVQQTYEFVCQNSCSAGMNRRPIEVIFTLEDASGDVFGRYSLNVRICSCPKRDKEKEDAEENERKSRRVEENEGQPPPGKKRKPTKRTEPSLVPLIKIEQRPNNHDNSVHSITLNVVGDHNKTALLQYAYDLQAGDMMRRGLNDDPFYRSCLESISTMMTNNANR